MDKQRHRVIVTHKLTNPKQWALVSSEDRPAGLASRGCSTTLLKQKDLWFYGPTFSTTSQEAWKPQTKHVMSKNDLDQRTINNQVLSQVKFADWTTEINHDRSFDTLVEITASILRLGNNCRPDAQRESGPIARIVRFSDFCKRCFDDFT